MGVSKSSSVGSKTDWASYTVGDSGNLVQPTVVRSGSNPAELICFFRDRRASASHIMNQNDLQAKSGFEMCIFCYRILVPLVLGGQNTSRAQLYIDV